jgi:hypothetical protein
MTAHQDVAGLVSLIEVCKKAASDGRTVLLDPASVLPIAEAAFKSLREAEAERDALKKSYDLTMASRLAWRRAAEAAESRLTEAMRVIGFYAEQKNWESPSSGFALQYDPTPSKIQTDWGETARAFIAGNGGNDE